MAATNNARHTNRHSCTRPMHNCHHPSIPAACPPASCPPAALTTTLTTVDPLSLSRSCLKAHENEIHTFGEPLSCPHPATANLPRQNSTSRKLCLAHGFNHTRRWPPQQAAESRFQPSHQLLSFRTSHHKPRRIPTQAPAPAELCRMSSALQTTSSAQPHPARRTRMPRENGVDRDRRTALAKALRRA